MKRNLKVFSYIFTFCLILFAVSFYRQYSIINWPDDRYRNIIVYITYLFLIFVWGYSIKQRIFNRKLKFYIYLEIAVMAFWIIVRYIQESILYKDIYLMRVSGYYIVIIIIMMPLLGFYGALYMDREDDFKFSRKWFLFLIPAFLFIFLAATNEYHHLMFKVLPNEGTNLSFHPNIGIYLVTLLSMIFEFSKLAVVLFKSRHNNDNRRLKYLPLLWVVLTPLFLIPNFAASFVAHIEVLEVTAQLCLAEILIWELCISIGTVPSNSMYEEVFERSTVDMQILDTDGNVITKSKNAKPCTNEEFEKLKREGQFLSSKDIQLRMIQNKKTYLVWKNDLSEINKVIDEINNTSKLLCNEVTILNQEVKIKSEDARISAKNKIYNRLTKDVGKQLELLHQLVSSYEEFPNQYNLWCRVIFIGTFIKRYCNLGLISQTSGIIEAQDMYLSLNDMVKCLGLLGIETELKINSFIEYSSNYALSIMKVVEFILESTDFNITSIDIKIDNCTSINIKSNDKISIDINKIKNNYSNKIDLSSKVSENSICFHFKEVQNETL